MYDLHIHTRNSSDSQALPEEIVKAAIEKGLSGIAVTDHVDFGYIYTHEQLHQILQNSLRDAAFMQTLADGRLTVLRGMEIGGVPYDPAGAAELIRSADVDVVLGSVHGVIINGVFTDSYRMDYSETPEEQIDRFLNAYFDVMLELVTITDMDVLTHLTYPLRYINGKYGRHVDEMRYRDRIVAVLQKIIERGIALEINTASVDRMICDFTPSANMLSLYRSLGGVRVTLGSDAHVPERIALAFDRAKDMLRTLGFTEYYYYKDRQPIPVSLFEEASV